LGLAFEEEIMRGANMTAYQNFDAKINGIFRFFKDSTDKVADRMAADLKDDLKALTPVGESDGSTSSVYPGYAEGTWKVEKKGPRSYTVVSEMTMAPLGVNYMYVLNYGDNPFPHPSEHLDEKGLSRKAYSMQWIEYTEERIFNLFKSGYYTKGWF